MSRDGIVAVNAAIFLRFLCQIYVRRNKNPDFIGTLCRVEQVTGIIYTFPLISVTFRISLKV